MTSPSPQSLLSPSSPPSPSSPLPRDWARCYLAKGWQVVPIPHGAKKPVINNWSKLRITFETLDRYFVDHPNQPQNIGVLMGDPSDGLVDVDIDCAEAWALADDYLPPTDAAFRHATAQGGHRLYRVSLPAPRYLKLTDPVRSDDGDGGKDGVGKGGRTCLLELRGTGHQTVMPGSTHPSGEPIVWVSPQQSPSPARPWAPDPAAVDAVELQRAVQRLAAAALLLRYYPHEGQRHDFWLPLSGALLRHGWSVAEVEAFLLPVAEQAGDEEWEDRRRTIHDTAAKLQNGQLVTGFPTLSQYLPKPVIAQLWEWLDIDTGAEPIPPFPLAVLPEPYRTFVAQTAASLDVPPDFVALPTLAAVSTALGRRWRVAVKDDWVEYPLLWVAIVGSSGTRKSQALRKALAPIHVLDRREEERYQEAVKAWEQARARRGATSDTTPAPTRRHRFASDMTIEAAMGLLPHTPGLLYVKDELLHLTAAMDRYTKKSGGGGAGDRQSLLSLWSLTPYKVVRKTQAPVLIERPFVAIAGGIQPDTLHKFGESDDPDGLLARFLWAYPDAPASRWTDAVVESRVEDAYQRAVAALAAADDTAAGGPRRVPLAPDARGRFAAYHDTLTRRIEAVRGSDPAQAAALSKLQGYTPRLALVLAAMRWSATGDIPPLAPGGAALAVIENADMEGAIALAEYFAAHHRRVLTAVRGRQGTTAARSTRGSVSVPARLVAFAPVASASAAMAPANDGEIADGDGDGDDDGDDERPPESVSDRLMQELRGKGEMPRAELLRRLRCPAQELDAAIAALEQAGRVQRVRRATGGRPAQVVRWRGATPS